MNNLIARALQARDVERPNYGAVVGNKNAVTHCRYNTLRLAFSEEKTSRVGRSVPTPPDRNRVPLSPLIPDFDRRIWLIAGKGGVGRSTTALAVAQLFAARGERTLLLEAGLGAPGPSAFQALLGVAPGCHPQAVTGTLSCARREPRKGQELFLREVVPVGPLVRAAMHSRSLARLLDAAPALDELGVMQHFLTLVEMRSGEGFSYDRVVLDLPATGHAMALADLPNTVLRLAPRGPIADRLRRGQALLHDAATTGALVVTIPEPLALREATDLATALRRALVPVAGFLVNRSPCVPPILGVAESLAAVFGSAEVLGKRTLLEQVVADERVAKLIAMASPVPVMRAPEALHGGLDAVAAVREAMALCFEERA